MSLEEIRRQNKQLVVEKALELFVANGIEKTKIADVARAAGLTERSVYRYFDTKSDMVLATAYLFWEESAERVTTLTKQRGYEKKSGLDRISLLLDYYSSMYADSPDFIRYILNAETSLYNSGISIDIHSRPPEPFETSKSPLVTAIRDGLADGSVDPNVDVKELYYNAYDSILGMMERLVIGTTSATDIDTRARMRHLCDMFIKAFKGE